MVTECWLLRVTGLYSCVTGYRVLIVEGDWIVQLCDWLQSANCWGWLDCTVVWLVTECWLLRVTGLYGCVNGYRVLIVEGDWIVQLCDWLQSADCWGWLDCTVVWMVTGCWLLIVEVDWIVQLRDWLQGADCWGWLDCTVVWLVTGCWLLRVTGLYSCVTGYRVLIIEGDWIVQLCDWLQNADCWGWLDCTVVWMVTECWLLKLTSGQCSCLHGWVLIKLTLDGTVVWTVKHKEWWLLMVTLDGTVVWMVKHKDWWWLMVTTDGSVVCVVRESWLLMVTTDGSVVCVVRELIVDADHRW